MEPLLTTRMLADNELRSRVVEAFRLLLDALRLDQFRLRPEEQYLVNPKVNRIRMGTPEKVNKHRMHRKCLDDITTLPQFSGLS